MNVNGWSTDPDSNDRIDPPILWPEGQDPGSVNNSARAMMAAVACLLKDTTGTLTAGGINAYTLTTNQTIRDLSTHFEVVFFVGSTNTGPATLSVGDTPARPLLRRHARQLGPGDLTPFVLYRAVYIGGLAAYLIVSPEMAAPGTIRLQAGADVDPGWLPCDGRTVSRSDYAALLDRIGTKFGGGDDATTFAIPDMRGRVPFCVDSGAGRLTGAAGLNGGLGNAGGSETVILSAGQMPSHTHTGTAQSGGATDGGTTGAAGDHNHGGQTTLAGKHGHTLAIDQGGSHNHTGSTATAGGEARKFSFASGNANIGAAGQAASFVADINVSGTPGFANERQTSGDPGHTHGVTIDQGGTHGHSGSAAEVDDHRHGISGSGTHTHPLPPAAAHTHPLAIDSAGQSQAHSNIPPGLVLQFVIKT